MEQQKKQKERKEEEEKAMVRLPIYETEAVSDIKNGIYSMLQYAPTYYILLQLLLFFTFLFSVRQLPTETHIKLLWFLILDLLQKGLLPQLRSVLRATERWITELDENNCPADTDTASCTIAEFQQEWKDAFAFLMNQLAILLTLNGINPVFIFRFFGLKTKIQ